MLATGEKAREWGCVAGSGRQSRASLRCGPVDHGERSGSALALSIAGRRSVVDHAASLPGCLSLGTGRAGADRMQAVIEPLLTPFREEDAIQPPLRQRHPHPRRQAKDVSGFLLPVVLSCLTTHHSPHHSPLSTLPPSPSLFPLPLRSPPTPNLVPFLTPLTPRRATPPSPSSAPLIG